MSRFFPPDRRTLFALILLLFALLLLLAGTAEKGRIFSRFTEKQPLQPIIQAEESTHPFVPGCLSVDEALAGTPAEAIPAFSAIASADRDTVGQLRTFNAYDHNKGEYHTVVARLLRIGKYGLFYADTSFTLADAAVQKLQDDFDGKIYPRSRNLFGEEANPGVDGDSLITILLYDIRDDNFYDNTVSSIIAGYFNPIDSDPLFVNHRNSNKREMVYVDNQALNDDPDFTLGVLAHEYQHLIHRNLDRDEETWLNEGMSELAIVNSGYPRSSPVRFLKAPDSPLTDFLAREKGVAEYDKVYLFFLYLHEHYGDALIRSIAGDPSNGIGSVQNGLNVAAGGIEFREVFGNWTVANYLDYDDGGDALYGYKSIDLPAITRSAVFSSLPVEQQNETLPRLTADYIEFIGGQNLEILFDGENANKNLSAKVVQFTGNNAFLSITDITLDNQQNGSLVIDQFGTTVTKAALIVNQYASSPVTATYRYRAEGKGITLVSDKLTYADGEPKWVFNVDPENILVVSFDAQPGMGLDSVRYKFVSEGRAEFRVWRSSPNQSTNYAIADSNLAPAQIMQVENIATSADSFAAWHTVDYTKNNVQLDSPFSVGVILKSGAPDPKLVADDTSTTDPARNFIYSQNSNSGQLQWFILPYDLFVEAYVSTFVSDTTTPKISLGVVQNPVFTENIDIYVIGEKPLNESSVKATVQEGTGSKEYSFTAVDNENLVFGSTDVRLSGPGQVTVIAQAKPARGSVAGYDSLTFTAAIAVPQSALQLTSSDQTVSLSVSKNAVSSPVWLTMIPYASHAARVLSQQENAEFVSEPVVIGPAGLRFERPLRLHWRSPAPDADNLTIARLDDEGRWLAVQTWRSDKSSIVTAEVSQTGTYGLLKSSAAVRAEQDDLPRSYSLQQNFPNPFNPETRIAFALPEKTAVRLRIYSVTGQTIAILVDGELGAGTYEYTWNGKSILGRDVPSGVYFYEIETAQFRQVKKMTLIR